MGDPIYALIYQSGTTQLRLQTEELKILKINERVER
jgi:hypothetical protein